MHGRAPRRHGCGQMISLETLDRLVLGGLEIWWTEPYLERVFAPGDDDMSEKIEAAKGKASPRPRPQGSQRLV